jgi:hypothetical protein
LDISSVFPDYQMITIYIIFKHAFTNLKVKSTNFFGTETEKTSFFLFLHVENFLAYETHQKSLSQRQIYSSCHSAECRGDLLADLRYRQYMDPKH